MTLKRWLNRVVFVLGLSLLAAYTGVRIDSTLESRAMLDAFERQKPASPAYAQRIPRLTSKPTGVSLWSAERVASYRKALHLAPTLPEAVLRIRKIGLEVPVLEGTDSITLNLGAGHITGTARPGEAGNIALAGHRDGFFRGLENVQPGDTLELESIDSSATYTVNAIQVVEPADIKPLQQDGQSTLTLVTCYPFHLVGRAPKRYVVSALLQKISRVSTRATHDDNVTTTTLTNQEKTK